MLLSDKWNDYELIDCGGGQKLERWGSVTLLRPEPQAVWPMQAPANVDAYYERQGGGGQWQYNKPLPQSWNIRYGALAFTVRPTGFKHTGLFPEQAANWDAMAALIAEAGREIKVLNLFAYTGGATLSCAAAGASVTHVDAAKGMVQWAKSNLALCGLAQAPVRFLVDDCVKFVQREIRRGNRYQAIIMDPPSYGRGPTGEMWKIEESIYPLVESCVQLLDNPLFFFINSYTTGLAPSVMGNVLKLAVQNSFGGHVFVDEIGLACSARGIVLPCGATGRWIKTGAHPTGDKARSEP